MLTIDNIYDSLIEINKSKFYSFAYPVTNEDECKKILLEFRKKYRDATHICFAYILSTPRLEKCSDDGEPTGTAGKPIIELLKKHELLSSKNNQPPKMDAEILLAYKSELFEICSNFTICKYEDYQAIGNASNYAHFILANTNKNHDVNQRIIKALDIVSKHSQHVSRPYILIDTKNQDYKLIEEKNYDTCDKKR